MSDRPPNILLIMTDQQRRDTLGAYGCDWIPTPALDALAADGATFTSASVDNPICTPSRASIFTGKPVHDHSVLRVHDNLPDDEALFTERLRSEAGYRTALFGKLHVSSRLREESERHPHDGFDIYEWCLEPSVSMDSPFNGYAAWLRTHAPDFHAALKAGGRRELHHPPDVHMSTWAAERTIDFIRSQAEGDPPFFCLMSLFDPHDPYEDHPLSARNMIDAGRIPPPVAATSLPDSARREQQDSYLGPASDFGPDDIREMRLGYGASIAFADQQIGRVLTALEASGLAGDTLVIFVSDHGDQLGDHGLFVKGVALYEPTVGVPLLLRWPGRVPAGLRTGALAQGRDIAATCLAAAGLDTSVSCPQSEDLVEMARNGRSRRKASVCAYRNSGIDGSGGFWSPPLTSTMVRNERYKLIASSGGGATDFELFDLAEDPSESRNLFGLPEIAAIQLELLAELSAFLQQEAASARPRVPPSIPSGAQLMRNRLKS